MCPGSVAQRLRSHIALNGHFTKMCIGCAVWSITSFMDGFLNNLTVYVSQWGEVSCPRPSPVHSSKVNGTLGHIKVPYKSAFVLVSRLWMDFEITWHVYIIYVSHCDDATLPSPRYAVHKSRSHIDFKSIFK